MSRITCPECQKVTETSGRPAPFCSRCDYPLFLAPGVLAGDAEGAVEEGARYRMPPVEGRERRRATRCRRCGEPNDPERITCHRPTCGARLYPTRVRVRRRRKPLPATVPLPPPEPVADAGPLPSNWPWVLTLAGLVVFCVVVLLLTR